MAIGSVFEHNREQAVSLPAETRFPGKVKKVLVRVVGQDRILSPVGNTWDSFFLMDDFETDEFMIERANQEQPPREEL